jgi:WD40 repeat protein
VVSASEDRFIIIWDMVTGDRRAEYWAGSPVLSVDWAPDSRRLAAGDAMGNLHLLEFQGASLGS